MYLQILLLLVFVGMVTFGNLVVRPKVSLPHSSKDSPKPTPTESAPFSEADIQRSLRQLQAQHRNIPGDSSEQSATSASGLSKTTGLGGELETALRQREKTGTNRELDVEDTCILQ
jgi:hypothetical protein